MFEIRNEQKQELKRAAYRDFERRMVKHLCKYFPIQGDVLGEDQMLKVVQYGIPKANSYGFTTQRNMALYLTLMPFLGSNFDKDVQFPWASQILSDKSIADTSNRADRLADRALEYRSHVIGDGGKYVKKLVKYRKRTLDSLWKPASGSLADQAIVQMENLYPEKYEAIGEEHSRRLVQYGIETCAGFGITQDRGVAILVVMMFLMGSGFYYDPIYPWAEEVLNDDSIDTEEQRVDKLFAAGHEFMDKWLACMVARGN